MHRRPYIRLVWNLQILLGSTRSHSLSCIWTYKPLWDTFQAILFRQLVSRSHPFQGGVTSYPQDHDCLGSAKEFFLCENHIFWTLLTKYAYTITLLLHGHMGFQYVLKCVAHHFQTVLGKFLTNTCQLLWNQKLLRICGFRIEKNSWADLRQSWSWGYEVDPPGRGWLRDTNWQNRNVRRVSHKGF